MEQSTSPETGMTTRMDLVTLREISVWTKEHSPPHNTRPGGTTY